MGCCSKTEDQEYKYDHEYYNFVEGNPDSNDYKRVGTTNWYYECVFWDQIPDLLFGYNYYKRAVRLRNENPEIARGTVSDLDEVEDENICAIKKTYNGSSVMLDGETVTLPAYSIVVLK